MKELVGGILILIGGAIALAVALIACAFAVGMLAGVTLATGEWVRVRWRRIRLTAADRELNREADRGLELIRADAPRRTTWD